MVSHASPLLMLGGMCSCLLLEGCASPPVSQQPLTLAGTFQDRWFLAHRSPAVYYPRGVSAATPMDGDHGALVSHGPGGAAFFIPTHLASASVKRALKNEALSLQDKAAAAAAVDAARAAKPRMPLSPGETLGLARMAVFAPMITTLGMVGAMVGGGEWNPRSIPTSEWMTPSPTQAD